MNKTTTYILIILGLLVINGWLFFSDGSSAPEGAKRYFEAEDLQRVAQFTFTREGEATTIRKEGNGWIVNDRFPADDRFVNTLFSILDRIEEIRNISDWNGDLSGQVEVLLTDNTVQYFQIASNATKTKSYFITDEKAVEVVVPGYKDNVVDVFLLHADQWRSRLVIDASWRSIQRLTIQSASQAPLELRFDDSFFLVNGIPPQDSSAVVDYLNQFQYFEANEMISQGRFPDLDSLATTSPLATIEIDDIKAETPTTLTVYPSLPNQTYHLVTVENKMMVIDAKRMSGMLVSAQDFMNLN